MKGPVPRITASDMQSGHRGLPAVVRGGFETAQAPQSMCTKEALVGKGLLNS